MRLASLKSPQGIAALCLIALLIWETMELDQPLALLLIKDGRFALEHHVILEKWLHDWIKPVLWAIYILLWTQWLRPWSLFKDVPRGRLGFAVLSILVCLLMISWMKKHSAVSCPWELREAGGLAAYVEHALPWNTWDQSDGGSGKCFPGGHASAGYAWLGLYFALLGWDAQRARWALIGSLVLGTVLGLAQQLRGAHFLSHAPWAALLCWYACTLMWALWPARFKTTRETAA